MSKVYFIKNISSASLIKIFEALNVDLKGKVAVKLSSGEPGGHNFLNAEMIKPLVDKVNGTIVECNTSYGGKRFETESHEKVMVDHGFGKIHDGVAILTELNPQLTGCFDYAGNFFGSGGRFKGKLLDTVGQRRHGLCFRAGIPRKGFSYTGHCGLKIDSGLNCTGSKSNQGCRHIGGETASGGGEILGNAAALL